MNSRSASTAEKSCSRGKLFYCLVQQAVAIERSTQHRDCGTCDQTEIAANHNLLGVADQLDTHLCQLPLSSWRRSRYLPLRAFRR